MTGGGMEKVARREDTKRMRENQKREKDEKARDRKREQGKERERDLKERVLYFLWLNQTYTSTCIYKHRVK